MITEHGILEVRPGQEADFVEAMGRAKALIAASPGFLSLRVERGIEQPSRFLLLVQWETLAAHTEGFRGSEAFHQWRALLHHFGTLKAIERASVTDLMQVDGISAETAARIYAFFHDGSS